MKNPEPLTPAERDRARNEVGVQGVGCRVKVVGCRVKGVGCRV